ncbi:LpqB family beta-propeller domain-containing protein [Pseudonocardia ailaonensis]|uniref:LpqB family beta-propeller domain-containing protein n=1 Tax=Pseudonocardia ailaonensis TaxID=367279 RepID=A0ABN2NPE0_9PSEU
MRRLLLLLVAVLLTAGCASVPGSSSVQVLRKVTEGDAPEIPAGPADGTDPLSLVRTFIYANGSTVDRHSAARRFLTPAASQGWDDGESLTVLDEQFDTVYPPTSGTDPNVATVRIRGEQIGTLDSVGAFEPAESPVEIDVTVRRDGGQWRIDRLPGGVLVRLSDFRTNFRTLKARFVDPVRRATVTDLRYLPAVPAQALPSRVVDMLLTGPSPALQGAAQTAVPATARLRTNVTESPDGALVVDLTQLGDVDEARRRLIAAQFVLTLAEINVPRVRLLADGAPLLDGPTDLTADALSSTNATVQPGADVPGLVVTGGRVRRLPGGDPLLGQAGNGAFDVVSAATTADGARLAAVARDSGRQKLLVGATDGLLAAVSLTADAMSRPTWTPTGSEVWTVLGPGPRAVVARVAVDPNGATRTGQVNVSALTALGPLTDLRLSRDGMRVAAIVGGGLVTGAVVRGDDGDVVVRNVRRLWPTDLTQVVGLDWRADESLIVVTAPSDRPVSLVSSDGLTLQLVPSANLTPPLRAVTAASSRPFLVADQGGIWSYDGGELDSWRQVLGASPDGIPLYPG